MFLPNQLVSSAVFAGLLFVCSAAPGQQGKPSDSIPPESQAYPARPVPSPIDVESNSHFSQPSSPESLKSEVGFRPASQMSSADQDLEANSEATIREKAGMQALGFNEGAWSFEQIVCPAFPNHLFLRFSRDDGTRQMTMFSAAIPRGNEGRIRIIPIVRKGYSLFSPVPINALTIAAFNHIRADEQYQVSPDWVGTGMCYAALAGSNPEPENPLIEDRNQVAPPMLKTEDSGGATINFIDTAPKGRLMAWSMVFDRKGKLVKATHVSADLIHMRQVPGVVDLSAK